MMRSRPVNSGVVDSPMAVRLHQQYSDAVMGEDCRQHAAPYASPQDSDFIGSAAYRVSPTWHEPVRVRFPVFSDWDPPLAYQKTRP
jgi:hypothetical protein